MKEFSLMALISSDNSSTPTTISDHFRTTTRKPKNPTIIDPNPQQLPSIMQSTTCKSSISSLIISTFNKTNNNTTSKKHVKGTSLLGFGCTSQQHVSVPGVIRSSANWVQDDNHNSNNNINIKSLKKGRKKKKNKQEKLQQVSEECSVVQDLWCAAENSSVDCVRPLSAANSRNKIDLHKLYHHNHNHNHINREHGSYSSRQRVNHEHVGGLNLESGFDASHIGPDVFEARYYRHLRNRSPEGLAEILMFQNGLLMGRRSGGLDRYRDWRLDVDSMTYEELLELGEKIGHVNTGLAEDQIGRCLRKTKLSVVESSQSHVAEAEPKCSICQEEYEEDDEMGKLECGHAYHLYCIKQWLTRKNVCPVCKTEASSQ